MILRCQLPRRSDKSLQCDGMIGGVPEGWEVKTLVKRFSDGPPGCLALRCWECKRIVIVCPPFEKAA